MNVQLINASNEALKNSILKINFQKREEEIVSEKEKSFAFYPDFFSTEEVMMKDYSVLPQTQKFDRKKQLSSLTENWIG